MWFCQFLPSVWLVSEEGRGRGEEVSEEGRLLPSRAMLFDFQ